jgi:hypothetical protein
VLGRNEDVVGDPARVESGVLGRDGHPGEPLPVERLAVVRQDQAQVQRGHDRTLSPVGIV